MPNTAPRSMVRTLRGRVLVIVGIAVLVVGAAGILGLRVLTDRNSDRQLAVAAQAVASWGGGDGERVISADRVRGLDPQATVVALADENHVVVVASGPSTTPLGRLQDVLDDVSPGEIVQAEVAGRSMKFTEVAFPADTVYDDDGSVVPVSTALVGIAVEGADRLVSGIILLVVGVLVAVLVLVAVAVTVIVGRTTRSLTDLAERVERGDLDGLPTSLDEGFAETTEIATAIAALDERRGRTEQQLRDFVADASHELRTPLTKIQGWSELHFQDPADPARTEQAFGSIVEESARMGVLIDQLTLLARAEASPQPDAEPVDLAEVARAVADEVGVFSPATPVAFETAGSTMIRGDGDTMTQLVRNLVGNAIVHAGPGASVTISVRGDASGVVLEVADDGIGMDPALRGRAFERFVRGGRRTGTGLGLAIVAGIASAHGGTVALESQPGAGTRVTARFPTPH